MIKKILFLLLFVSNSLFAQQASIRGKIVDSADRKPLESATVSIFNASENSLISVATTNKEGIFAIKGLKGGELRIVVSYIGFNKVALTMKLQAVEEKDLGVLGLIPQQLKEVLVRGKHTPLIVKNDTVEFFSGAYKVREDAVIEELLKKLPGVQINQDGSIYFNGKKISKLLIDGKEFFGSDPTIATRQLDANIIDRIQVYDDKDNLDNKIPTANLGKTVDLRLKQEVKKRVLGKLSAGLGSAKRYTSSAIASTFRDTLQVSILATGNNLTRTGFSREELGEFGGFNRSGPQDYENSIFGGRGKDGQEEVTTAGINLNNDFGKKLRINLNYFMARSNLFNKSLSVSKSILDQQTLDKSFNSQSEDESLKHNLGGSMQWRPDQTRRLRYSFRSGSEAKQNQHQQQTKNSNTNEGMINTLDNKRKSDENSADFYHSFTFNKQIDQKGKGFNLYHTLNFNKNKYEESLENDFSTFFPASEKMLFKRSRFGRTTSLSLSGSGDYTYPVSKNLYLGAVFLSTVDTEKNLTATNEVNAQGNDFIKRLDDQSGTFERLRNRTEVRPEIVYIWKGLTVKAGLSANHNHSKSTVQPATNESKNDYFNLFPSFRIKNKNFNLDFEKRLEMPQFNDLQPITREITTLYKIVGNPHLLPQVISEFNFHLNNFFDARQLGFGLYLRGKIIERNIIDELTFSDEGAYSTTKRNSGDGLFLITGGNITKSFRKNERLSFSVGTNIDLSLTSRDFILNSVTAQQTDYSVNFKESATLNFNDMVEIGTNYRLSALQTNYHNINFEPVRTFEHSIQGNMIINFPKRVVAQVNYSLDYRPQLALGLRNKINIFNVSIGVKLFRRNDGQLKISAYDLFNQNYSVYRYSLANTIISGERELLKRYFLLTYQHKFNIGKKK